MQASWRDARRHPAQVSRLLKTGNRPEEHDDGPPVALRNVMAAAKTFHADNGPVRRADSLSSGGRLGRGPLRRWLRPSWHLRGRLDARSGGCNGDRFGAAALTESNRCLLITDGPKGVRYGAPGSRAPVKAPSTSRTRTSRSEISAAFMRCVRLDARGVTASSVPVKGPGVRPEGGLASADAAASHPCLAFALVGTAAASGPCLP